MEKFADGRAQRIDGDRFAEDDVDGLRLRAGDFDQGAKAGEHDHRDVLIQLLDKARSLIAAHLRHDAVEDDEIEVVPAKFFQRLATAGRGGNRMAIKAEIGRDHFKDARFIIDYENVQG